MEECIILLQETYSNIDIFLIYNESSYLTMHENGLNLY
ncbi:hypothetical protein AM412_003230 [Acinetobacter baumannii]|nr:hypothetical protein AM412_003230 [Acinetobacter baumannii]OKO39903.1 hypothetical protein AM416_003229 [Acinetobacter baumannii]SLM56431.1 Uncharacterised protein [Acinetobacter baumannii]SMB66395.1 Uncharacterised protein [Acinetobacter baumannii]SMD55903.1 Uncharacterised protein [Acinetobacter baumannii]